jgi:hypothetical protein
VQIVELEVSFQYNSFGDAAAAALAELIRKNSTLRSLDLRSCRVGDAGALALVTAMAAHPSLMRLNLRSNVVTDQGARNLLIHLALYPISRSIGINVADNSVSVETQRKLRRVVNGKPYPTIIYDEDDLFPPTCLCKCERCLYRTQPQQDATGKRSTGKGVSPTPQQQKITLPQSASALIVSVVSQLETAKQQNSTTADTNEPGRLPKSYLCVCTCGANNPSTPLVLTDSEDELSEFKEKEIDKLKQHPATLADLAIKVIAENECIYPRDIIQKSSLPPHLKQKINELKALKRQKEITRNETRKSQRTPTPWPFPTGDFVQEVQKTNDKQK